MEQVLGSLELSVLTGPNEGYVMAERGIFAFHYGKICRRISRAVRPLIWLRGDRPESGKIRDGSFHKTRARAERATKRRSRDRAFAERDRTTTGILAKRLPASCNLCVFLTILPRSWGALVRTYARPGRNQSSTGGTVKRDVLAAAMGPFRTGRPGPSGPLRASRLAMKDGVTLFARREFFGGRGRCLLILWGCISSASICRSDRPPCRFKAPGRPDLRAVAG